MHPSHQYLLSIRAACRCATIENSLHTDPMRRIPNVDFMFESVFCEDKSRQDDGDIAEGIGLMLTWGSTFSQDVSPDFTLSLVP